MNQRQAVYPSHHPNHKSFVPPKDSNVQLSLVGTYEEEIVFAKSDDNPSTSSLSTAESSHLLVDLLLHSTLCDIQLSELGQLTEEDLGCLCRLRGALVPPLPLVGRYVLLHSLVEVRLLQLQTVAAPDFAIDGFGGRDILKEQEGYTTIF